VYFFGGIMPPAPSTTPPTFVTSTILPAPSPSSQPKLAFSSRLLVFDMGMMRFDMMRHHVLIAHHNTDW
jgi:hypothetical protein